jgi:hypothetical protein
MAISLAEEALFVEDLRNGVNLFLGSGEFLPDGKTLQAALVGELNLSDFSELDLQSLYAVAIQTDRDRVRKVVRDLLTVHTYDQRYNALRNLNISSIYTTNIDDLITSYSPPKPVKPQRHCTTAFCTVLLACRRK